MQTLIDFVGERLYPWIFPLAILFSLVAMGNFFWIEKTRKKNSLRRKVARKRLREIRSSSKKEKRRKKKLAIKRLYQMKKKKQPEKQGESLLSRVIHLGLRKIAK